MFLNTVLWCLLLAYCYKPVWHKNNKATQRRLYDTEKEYIIFQFVQ